MAWRTTISFVWHKIPPHGICPQQTYSVDHVVFCYPNPSVVPAFKGLSCDLCLAHSVIDFKERLMVGHELSRFVPGATAVGLVQTMVGCGTSPQDPAASHPIKSTALTITKTTQSVVKNSGHGTFALSHVQFLSSTLGFGLARSGSHLMPITTHDGGKSWTL